MRIDAQVKESRKYLSHARMLAVRKAPFMADMIYALIPFPSDTLLGPGVGTGVTEKGILIYNPYVFNAWTNADRATALVHEAEHLRREHAARFRALNKPDQHKRWNWCGDAELNDDLQAMGFKLLETDIMPKMLGCQNGRTAEEYFLKAIGGPASNRPSCGSGAGSPLADESGLPDVDPTRPRQLQNARRRTAEAAVEQARMRPGSVPADILRDCVEQLKPPVIPWQRHLQVSCSRASALRSGQVDLSYARMSRRQCAMGFGPGVPIVRSFVAPTPNVIFIQDTSMSMHDSVIAAALAEVPGILRDVPSLTFMSCDAAVQAIKPRVRNVNDVFGALKGGGGTDFRPAFAEASKMRPRPDIIVFATDLYGTFPAVKPAWAHVIWLILGSSPPPTPWGTRIQIAS